MAVRYTATLRSALKQEISKRDLSVRAAAKIMGMHHSTLLRFLQGQTPHGTTIDTIEAWIGGYDHDHVKRTEDYWLPGR